MALGMLGVLWTVGPGLAQTSPTALAELSLEELIQVEIIVDGSMEDRPAPPPWTVAYRYVQRSFDEYRKGTDAASFAEILDLFPVVPTTIRQEAHLLELTRRTHGRAQLSLLVPFIRQTTDHIRRTGAPFTLESQGIGAPLLSVTARPWQWGPQLLHLSVGVSLPLGSIDETGPTPRGPGTQLPYTMQIGSGTYDLETSLTLSRRRGRHGLGARLFSEIHLGRNDHDYSLGDRWLLSGWWRGHFESRWQPSFEVHVERWSRIDGFDAALDPNIAPVADANFFGGRRIDAVAGLRYALDPSDRHTVEITVGVPLYQSLHGPQPERDWEISGGWQLHF